MPALLDSPMNPKRYLRTSAVTTGSSVPPGTSPSVSFTTNQWSPGTVIPVFAIKTATVRSVVVKYYEVATLVSGVVKKWYISQGNTFNEYTPPAPNTKTQREEQKFTTGQEDIVRQTTIAPSPLLFGVIVLTVVGLGIATIYYWNKKRSR
jgi:hypothetical protein